MRRNDDKGFQVFWDAYGMKLDRIAAERAWRRLSAADRRAALAGIAAYRESCLATGVRMMYAQGYLNHRRWEDEAPVAQDARQDRQSPTPPDGEMTIW